MSEPSGGAAGEDLAMPDEEVPAPEAGLSRRTFIGGLAATALLPMLRAGASPDHTPTPAEIEAWKKTLFQPGEALVYRASTQPQAAFPTGGIGCGNVYVGVGGHLRDWLIFNNTAPVQVPNSFFAVRAAVRGQEPVARMLQTESKGLHIIGQFGGSFRTGSERVAAPGPGIADAELSGEYPHVSLRYLDPALPVEVRMEALTPFIPHDARSSAFPGTGFVFHVKNPGKEEARVSLLFALHNAVGLGVETRAGGYNEPWREGGLTGIRLAAEPGRTARLGGPAELVAGVPGFQLPGVEMPADLQLRVLRGTTPAPADLKLAAGRRGILWLEDPATLDEPTVEALRQALEAGATVVLSGTGTGVLESWAATRAGGANLRPDILFEDFESGTFDRWTVQGTAFQKAPQRGTLPGQQPVSGFRGRFLVNSFTAGDTPTGRITSVPFRIERRYIKFLIGGGHWPRTCMNLLVDGQVVRTATGKDLELLEPHAWDVSDLAGREGRLEIVDEETGGWGHINVDQIVFSDLAGDRLSDGVVQRLDQLLPISFNRVTSRAEAAELVLPARDQAAGLTVPAERRMSFERLRLELGGRALSAEREGPMAWERQVGQGRLVLLSVPLLPQDRRGDRLARQRALAALAWAAGLSYAPGSGIHPADPTFGELAISSPAGSVTGRVTWEDPKALWQDFTEDGKLAALGRAGREDAAGSAGTNAALAVEVKVGPGDEAVVPFFLTWHFPNYYFGGARVGNRYTRFWSGARESARELGRDWKRLHDRTHRYREAVYATTLPYYLTDCITSQSSTIRSEVCIWLEDGTFAGFEGADGCCPMNCSHVWGYEQSLSRLFPELERSMREADFMHQQRPDGGLNNRIALPLQPGPTGEMPFADGHASGVLKAYREHLNSPDDTWLREYWPRVKKAVEYLVSLDGETPDGILEGPQWNTYDCVVFGPNSFIGSYYLAALRAGEEMAKRMGEPQTAARWRAIFETGRKRLVELCWNGEYFVQNLPNYTRRATQWGPGCLSDQLIGQWWAHQLRLGYLLPPEHVRSALKAVMRHNWRWDLSDFRHNQRVFADGHDKGLLNCTWPRGGRPANPILYCDEVWTGVEYQVAGHLVYEGMLEDAFTIVRGARERYDGKRRNPWNEIECGGHYARAMANWSLLTGLSGYHYDGPEGLLAFDPILRPEDYRSLFTVAEGWGRFSQERKDGKQRNELRLDHGKAVLRELQLGIARRPASVTVRVNGRRVAAEPVLTDRTLRLALRTPLELGEGQTLRVELG